MPNTKDLIIGGKINAQFKGDPGCGKTIAAASFPGPIKFFDHDGRMRPVKLWYPDKSIEYQTYGAKNFADFLRDWQKLQDYCPYATVVLDSFTLCTINCVMWQLGMKSGGKLVAGNVKVPSFDEFNGETTVMSQVLDIGRYIPAHFIVTTHPVVKTQIAGGKSTISRSVASFGTKIASLVPAYFDEVYHFNMEAPLVPGEKVKRIVITENIGEDYAKTALPIPGSIDITGKKLFEVLQGYLSEYNITIDSVPDEVRPESDMPLTQI